MYRVSYGEDASLTYEQARANLDNKYNAIFPGPKPVKYDLRMFSPYKLHQRRSNKFRVGCVLLAGDAAHACNPFGGMGLTGGLCDAGGLADCLVGVLRRGCDDNLLDKYAEIRRKIFDEVRDRPFMVVLTRQVTDPISQGNIERLFSLNPDTAATDYELFRKMNESEEFKREMLKGAMALQHDFTQYYPDKVKAHEAIVSL
jgi:2-polyprenyl-6-methoxyphenol hydroxylase-like FAD-dependent oxidoreductase